MRTGETKAIVLLGEQGSAIAVSMTVRATAAEKGCRFTAPCPLSGEGRKHVRTVLAPLTKEILAARGQSAKGWRISLSLPASAMLRGEQVRIDGNSADLAIVLAMLSAVLNEPLSDNLAATGQITNASGRVEMVRGLHEKLALQDPRVSTVLVPAWNDDPVFEKGYPEEFVAVRTQVKTTTMCVVVVRDVAEAFSHCTKKAPTPVEAPVFSQPAPQAETAPNHVSTSDEDREAVRRIVNLCSERNLVAAIDIPLEQKFGAITYPAQTITSIEQVLPPVAWLLGQLGIGATQDACEIEAVRLSEAAFAADNGISGAFSAARIGGLRPLFNRVFEQIKREKRHFYVQGCLRQFIDPTDGSQRLRLAQAILTNYEALLPNDDELAPVEQLANRLEELVLTITAGLHEMTKIVSR